MPDDAQTERALMARYIREILKLKKCSDDDTFKVLAYYARTMSCEVEGCGRRVFINPDGKGQCPGCHVFYTGVDESVLKDHFNYWAFYHAFLSWAAPQIIQSTKKDERDRLSGQERLF